MSSFATIERGQNTTSSSTSQRRRITSFRESSPTRRLVRAFRSLRNQSAHGYAPSRITSAFSARRHQSAQDPTVQSVELVATDAFIFSGPALKEDSSTDNLSWSNIDPNTPSTFGDSRRPSTINMYFGPDNYLQSYEDMDVDTREDMRQLEDRSSSPKDDDCEVRQQILQQCLDFMDISTLKSLRLCNRTWQHTVDEYAPLKFPAIYRVPHEIIQHIFKFLSPVDFNSARHTCHAWMSASLDISLSKTMLSRRGWSRGAGIESFALISARTQRKPSTQWILSCHIARECALLPQWSGNGLRRSSHLTSEYGQERSSNALVVQCTTDFTELSSADYTPASQQSCGLGFTMSNCGKYLLIAEGCSIYVYHLEGVHIRPVTTVVCPKRVLAVAMDTAARRYSVAALLDGRMGMVCDLEDHIVTEPPSPHVYSDRSLEEESVIGHSAFTSHHSIHDNDDLVAVPSRRAQREELGRVNSIHVLSPNQSVHVRNTSRSTEENGVITDWPTLLPAIEFCPSIPTSSAPLSVYHSLCSPDDPPQSVAICPSRRCLAFGCSSGIELHWVDATSGRNLMKWFPLTAPSQFLFFLPSRRHIDNPNKLRLISSKAGPGQRGGVERFARRNSAQRQFVWSWGRGVREADYDHYAALPLSDGAHVLFTLPGNGQLYLGSDAPIGGPTKLLRKIQFEPPPNVTCSKDEPVSLYAAGSDLTWGVRVVAAYKNDLVLFTVPPDVFAEIKKLNTSTDATTQDDTEEDGLGAWKDWWEPSCLNGSDLSWPIVVRGAKIGKVDNVVDLAVQSSSGLVVWAVSTTGVASTWTLGDGVTHTAVQRHVEQDGSVHMLDEESDWSRGYGWRDVNVSNAPRGRAVIPTSPQEAAYMQDADAYAVAYPQAESSQAYRPFAQHADRDSSVSMLNRASNDAGEGSSRRRFDLDGVCEFEISDRPTVDYSACITTHKQVVHDAVMVDEVEGAMPFPIEILCAETPAVRVANTSAKRDPSKSNTVQLGPLEEHLP